jgi:ABC-type transport system involved in cytochrome bd biosynthesis fused ATPase/permease subunit
MVQAFALGRGILHYLERLRIHKIALARLGRARVDLFDALEPLVPGTRRGFGSGEVLSAFVGDTATVTEAFAKRHMAAVDVGTCVVCAGLLDTIIDPRTGLILVAGSVLAIGSAVLSSRRGARREAAEAELRTELAEEVASTMRATRELVAFGRTDLVIARLRDVEARSTAIAGKRARALGAARSLISVFTGVTLIAVVISAYAAHSAGRVSGVFVAIVTFAAFAALNQCEALPAVLFDSESGRSASRRLASLATIGSSSPKNDLGRLPSLQSEAAALDSAVVVRDQSKVLSGVSLALAPHQRLGVVGPNGSGKTSVLYTLLGFLRCDEGQARLGGVDVEGLTRKSIANFAAWMPDETHIFEATLGANLRLGRQDASDKECSETLSRVGLARWYASLVDGLDTQMDSAMVGLSSGERQRLGLARTLLTNTPVLLLDEPTAHIDPFSVEQLLGDVIELTQDKCVLVVSHELDIDQFVDVTIELHDGRVLLSQPHAGTTTALPLRSPDFIAR